ncbi:MULTISPECIES: TlpA family protein disulfide reductase [Flavobacterium]|nr:TlpA disulfide reductase family protein [Flavobacterium sp. N1846]
MLKIFVSLSLLLFCQSDKMSYEIILKPVIGPKKNIFHMNRMSYELNLVDEITGFSNTIHNEYKGISKNDSVFFYLKSESFSQYIFDLYKEKKYDKAQFLEYCKKRRIDTLELSQKSISQGFVVMVEYQKGNVFITADTDRNKNFGDNLKQTFDIKAKISKDDDRIEKSEIQDYSYEIYSDKKIKIYHRKIIIYPSVIHENNETKISFKYKYVDFWEGKLNFDNQKFSFFYQGIDNNRGGLFIIPKEIDFKHQDDSFVSQFQYYKGDTILINKQQFKFDSVNSSISKLYLSELKKFDKNYGNYIGTYLENFKIIDFKGIVKNTDLLIKDKQYTLIDFWASWCGPCIERFPEIKQLQEKYESKLNMIGISTDVSIEKAKQTIEKYNISWGNFHGSFKTKINKNLNIKSLPTYFLIDRDGKIIYRGENVKEIIKILEK